MVKKKLITIIVAIAFLFILIIGAFVNTITTMAEDIDKEGNEYSKHAINSDLIDGYLADKEKVSNPDRIKRLVEEMNLLTLKLDNLLDTDSAEYKSILNRINDIENEMSDAGASRITSAEVSAIFGINRNLLRSEIDPPVYPSDTEDVRWFTYQYDKTYRGKTYTIFEMQAMPTDGNGKLYSKVQDNNLFVESSISEQSLRFFAGKITKSIINKLGSRLPLEYRLLLSLIPVDEIFDEEPQYSYDSRTYFANMRANTTMMYTFVYNDNKGYEGWEFMMTTHYTNVNYAVTFYLEDENGRFSTKLLEKDFNVHSDNYDNVNWAISNFQRDRWNKHVNVPLFYYVEGITLIVDDEPVYLPFKTYKNPGDLYL